MCIVNEPKERVWLEVHNGLEAKMMEKLCKQWLDSQRFDWDVLMNNSLITNLINTAAN